MPGTAADSARTASESGAAVANLRCKLPCGCWVEVAPDDSWRIVREHRDGRMSEVEVPHWSQLATGYMLAASRGVGPWAKGRRN